MEQNENVILRINEQSYSQWVQELKTRYLAQRMKATVAVNSALLEFYWNLGKDISLNQADNRYGTGFYRKLSKDMEAEIPGVKGFSPTNLKYTKYFYELYAPSLENRQQLVDDFERALLYQIPWGHHIQIIDKCKGNTTKAIFFVKETLQFNWSRAVLLNFLDSGLYEAKGKAVTNFKDKLPEPQGDLAQELTKDPYNFDFLALTEGYKEKELEAALVDNISRFLIELGTGFAYMGRQYRLVVNEDEFFIDLLFYNTRIHAYYVFELKASKFSPEHLGQLGFYVSAVNHQLKTEQDNPTVGVLICKEKNEVVACYSLDVTDFPVGISEYQLSKLYPADFKSVLPSIEELENELKRYDFNREIM